MVSNLKTLNKLVYSHQNKTSNLIRNSECMITKIHTASSSINRYEFMVNNFPKYAQTYHKPIHTITQKTVQKSIINPNLKEYVNWSKLWSSVNSENNDLILCFNKLSVLLRRMTKLEPCSAKLDVEGGICEHSTQVT